jgi:hypothetical protein
MPSKAVLDAFRSRQEANWTTLDVFYPNDAAVPSTNLAAFVQVEFPIGGAERLVLAYNGLHREVGTVRFVVHCRIKTGSDQAFVYADELRALFRSVVLIKTMTAMLETEAPTPVTGLGADVAYYLAATSVPYRYLFTP